MSQRTTVPGDGAWHQIGTGPATVELLSTQVEVMVECAATVRHTGVEAMAQHQERPLAHQVYTAQLSSTTRLDL